LSSPGKTYQRPLDISPRSW